MQRHSGIERILIPYDFSETAALSLEHAVFMAKLLKAEIKLLHVIETVSFTSAISHAFSGFEKKIETSATEKLQEMADRIHEESGVVVTVGTEVGRTYKKIAESAKQWHADLIVMGTHGASGPQEHVVGTNTLRTIAEAKCPVISVATHAKKLGFTKILVPIDDSEHSREKIPLALELANAYKSHIFVLGLMPGGSEEKKNKFRVKIDQVENWLIKHEAICDSEIIENGDYAKSTLESAAKYDVDLILIMTEQNFSLTGNSLGKYANQIINHSTIPVLSVQPLEVDPDRVTVSL
jgi:nucleotide-binding universal stress UspA family protein